MTMQPFKRSRRTIPLSTLLLRVGLIAMAVVILFFIIRTALRVTGVPVMRGDAIREGFASKRALIAKVGELEQAIEAYKVSNEQTALLQKENEQLKAELGRMVDTKGVIARVLVTPERSFYDTMILDAGEDEGIQVGQIAYAFDSVAIGTVASVQNRRATVQLFSAPERETAGTAEGSEVAITLIGRGVGEFEVRMPRDVHFSIGELISYQSIDTAVLAKIEKIVTDPRDPFQRLLAKAPVNLAALKFVVVR